MNQPAAAIEDKTPVADIAEFQPFESALGEFRGKYEGVVYDLTVPEQEKQARSDRLAIGKVISKLDATHKEVKAPLKARVDLLDGERKRIKDQLLEIQGDIKKQITEHEEAIEAHEKYLAARVDGIRSLALFDSPPTSELVQQRLDQAKTVVVDNSFEDQESQAALAKLRAMETLETLLAGVKAQEKEAREQDERRLAEEERIRKEHEERQAREAKELAERKAAEAVAREKQKAEEAEQARLDAEQRAADAEANAAREAEEAAKRATEEAERQVQEAAEHERLEREQREADQENRKRVREEVSSALGKIAGLDRQSAHQVFKAIDDGLIPHTKITY